MNIDSVFQLLLFFGGAILFIIGIYSIANSRRTMKKGTRTRARIIGYDEKESTSNDSSHIVYHPIIEFRNRRTGDKVTLTLDYGSSIILKTKSFEIFYLIENGEYNIIANTTLFRIILPWGFVLAGLLMAVIGVLGFLNLEPLSFFLNS